MGFLHIYCGDGKGKTTAAIGLAIRTLGAGKKVCIYQFLKNGKSSEFEAIAKLDNITIKACENYHGFLKNKSDEEKIAITKVHNDIIEDASEMRKKVDVIILDELCAAYNKNVVDKAKVLAFIRDKSDKCEVVITGREPCSEFIEIADYISEIKCVKHPYNNGVKARKGIEF